jgi:hypothetical protein
MRLRPIAAAFIGLVVFAGFADAQTSRESTPESRAAADSATPLETRPATPQSRPYRPPGSTYRMPGADMEQLPLSEWAAPGPLKNYAVDVLKKLLPNDAGAAWIGLFVVLLVGASFRPFRFGRNLECVALLALTPFYVHMLSRQATLDDDPKTRPYYVIGFTAVYALTAWWFLRGLIGSRARPSTAQAAPALSQGAVRGLALALVFLNAFLVVARPPDDCGHYVNRGAQRMLERGTLPYADAKLLGGAAATYGPVLYAVNGAILALRADPTPNDPETWPNPEYGYVVPPVWAAKATVAFFHLLGLFSLYVIGRRLRDAKTGWALIALYAGSPYVLGLGGDDSTVVGLGYVSHIGPAAMVLATFACLPKPFFAGALLNLSIATGYFPAFVWPAFSAYFGTRRKGDGLKFQIGFFLTGALVLGSIWRFTPPLDGKNAFQLFLEGSIAHQEAPDQYGSSTLSFFGAHPAIKKAIRSPIVEGERFAMITPVFLLAAGFGAAGFLLGRRRTPGQLAFLTASTVACVQLWKHHASGTYVEWYYPLLLIGIFASKPEDAESGGGEDQAAPPILNAASA